MKKRKDNHDEYEMIGKHHRGKFFMAGFICGLAAVITFIQFGGASYLEYMGSSMQVTSIVLQEKISEINELSTASYTYTNADIKSDARTLFGLDIPLTKNKYIVKYDGKIKAGVNMEEARVEVKENYVVVELPEAKVLSNEIETIDILDETNNIFNPIKVNNVTDYFIKEQKKNMEQRAIEKGILNEAKENANTYIKAFLYEIIPDEYELEIR